MAFRRGARPPLWAQPARRHIITDATAGRRHLENNATGNDYIHWCRYCQPHYHHHQRRSAQSAGDSTGHLCGDVCACRSFIPVSAISSCVHIGLVCFTPITGSREPAVKLPKFSLPTFSGEYLKFNIPNSSKFAYLNSLLSGDAVHAVSGIAMTDAGFIDACSILKERFGDSNQLIFKLCKNY